MKILSMTATFGKLTHETLALEPGLNILQAPNEWGKSTWCAFILAMLYGIDSRAHSATRQGLADKARYEPWSGELMSGRMDILWNGRAVTLERSSTKRAQLRQFRAYETDSGLPVPELTAENCGQMLLGVEKEVFQRAGFIRLSDMPVTQNDALRRRLNALVTTGDESGAADLLAQRLTKLKNECRLNRSHGLLPQAEQQHLAFSEKLRQLEDLRTQAARLKQQCASCEDELAQLRNQSNDTQALAHRAAQLRQRAAALAEQLSGLQAPAVPASFQGLTVEDGCRQARTDCAVYKEACRERRGAWKLLLCFLPALLAFPCLLIPHWIGRATCFLGVLTSMLLAASRLSAQERAATTAKALGQKYSEAAPAQWETSVREALTAEQTYVQTRSALEAEQAQLSDELTQLLHTLPSAEQSAQAVESCQQRLRQLHLALGRIQGQMDALGTEADLRKSLSAAQSRIQGLTDTLTAIELAQRTLQEAAAQLQRRFAPRITQRARELFSRMTGGRYDRLTLSEDLSLLAAAQNEDILRSILWRSDGTADQLYLALRLAVSAELTPGAPLVLDDALVRFDDERLKSSIAVLKEESKSRQILLFTCQGREKQALA